MLSNATLRAGLPLLPHSVCRGDLNLLVSASSDVNQFSPLASWMSISPAKLQATIFTPIDVIDVTNFVGHKIYIHHELSAILYKAPDDASVTNNDTAPVSF